MKRQLKGILYYLISDIRYAFSIFWIIIGGFLALSVIIDFMIGSNRTVIQFNFSGPIYIFASIVGFLTVRNVLTYLIKMGATRKLLYIGVVIYFFCLSIVNALIANGLDFIVSKITNSDVQSGLVITDGESSLHFHHLADVVDKNNYLYQIIIDSSISFFFLSVFFIIGLIFYRFGLLGGFSFVGIIIFTFIFGLANGWLLDFFIFIFTDFSIVFFYQLAFVGLGIYLISYVLLRRLTL